MAARSRKLDFLRKLRRLLWPNKFLTSDENQSKQTYFAFFKIAQRRGNDQDWMRSMLKQKQKRKLSPVSTLTITYTHTHTHTPTLTYMVKHTHTPTHSHTCSLTHTRAYAQSGNSQNNALQVSSFKSHPQVLKAKPNGSSLSLYGNNLSQWWAIIFYRTEVLFGWRNEFMLRNMTQDK